MSDKTINYGDAIKVLSAQVLFCAVVHLASILTIKKRLISHFEKYFNIKSQKEISDKLTENTCDLVKEIYSGIVVDELNNRLLDPIKNIFIHIFDESADVNKSKSVKYAQLISYRDSTLELLNVLLKNTSLQSLSIKLTRILSRILAGNDLIDVCKYIDNIFNENGANFNYTELDRKLSHISKCLLLGANIPDTILADVKLMILYSLPNLYCNKSEEAKRLVEATKQAFFEGIKYAKKGNRIGDVSHAIGEYIKSQGYSVVREFEGHGIGRDMHEEPEIPNYGRAGRGIRLEPGMTLAIEPMVIQGKPDIWELEDGWTIVTQDGSLAAHYENTILITENEPELLTIL